MDDTDNMVGVLFENRHSRIAFFDNFLHNFFPAFLQLHADNISPRDHNLTCRTVIKVEYVFEYFMLCFTQSAPRSTLFEYIEQLLRRMNLPAELRCDAEHTQSNISQL